MRSGTPGSDTAMTDQGLYRLVEARHGRFLVNPNDIYIGRALLEFGEFSELESQTILQAAPEGGIVAEVGANIGAHTVAIARKVGPAGRVHAFEPQPIVFQNLCANLALNSFTNVYAYNMACGESRDMMNFPDINYAAENNFGAVELSALRHLDQGQRIQIAPLDEFQFPALNLLKIDAEGMEAEVIKGASDTISRHKPVLYIENDRVDRSEKLIRLIFDLGYRLWWHLPPLFNPQNWAKRETDLWPGIVSFNMLGVHNSIELKIEGMPEIEDPTAHPLDRACA